jgi:hypothetical protein
LYRGLGSIAFMAACRFALLVGRDPLVPGRCVLAQVRNSLAWPQPGLAYQITGADGAHPAVDWSGTSPSSADELLAGTGPRRDGSRDRAAAFLEQFLAAGPRTSHDLWQAAQEAALSARTVQRAKQGLGIRRRRVSRGGKPVSYWLLPGQELPDGLSDCPEFDRLIAELERQFPPRPPLDDEDLDGDSA